MQEKQKDGLGDAITKTHTETEQKKTIIETVPSVHCPSDNDEGVTKSAPNPLEKAIEIVQSESNHQMDISSICDDDLPDELAFPEGGVGKLARYIYDSSVRPQKLFSIGAALAASGAVLGQSVQDENGQPPSMYVLACGPSSSGKDHPKKCIQSLLEKVGMGDHILSKITSESAMELALSELPSRLVILDEVGHELANLKRGGRSDPNLGSILPMLTDLWSEGVKDGVYTGKTRATKRSNGDWIPPVHIHRPTVSTYCTGTPERVYECMSKRDVADGFLGRFLPIILDRVPPRNIKKYEEFPQEIIDEYRQAREALIGGNCPIVSQQEQSSPKIIPISEDARALFDNFCNETDEKLESASDDTNSLDRLWGKTAENASRIALVIGCFRNPANPTIEHYDAWYGVELITYLTKKLIAKLDENLADSYRERDSKLIERIIKKKGNLGITISELTGRTRSIKSYDRRELLQDLVTSGGIIEFQTAGTGHKQVTCYRQA